MSMTQEEVTKRLKALKARCERLIVSSSAGNPEEWRKDAEAIDMAITALRPVSREQVEKVWRGEWNNINPAVLKPGVSWVCRCAKCGCPQDYKHNFCPNCGAAQTDEAVQMVMRRLEALKDRT